MRENLRKIQVVCQNDVAMLARVAANLFVGSARIADRRSVNSFVTRFGQMLNPPRGEVHVDQKPHQLASGNSRP
jgi:hypothetical protein